MRVAIGVRESERIFSEPREASAVDSLLLERDYDSRQRFMYQFRVFVQVRMRANPLDEFIVRHGVVTFRSEFHCLIGYRLPRVRASVTVPLERELFRMVAAIRLENGGILLGNGVESRLLQEFGILEDVPDYFHGFVAPIESVVPAVFRFSLQPSSDECPIFPFDDVSFYVSFVRVRIFGYEFEYVPFVDFLSVHVLESGELHERESSVFVVYHSVTWKKNA